MGDLVKDKKTGFRFSPRPNRADEISWRSWGEEAFREAEQQGKLVFLSISAVWCHWCHVMDETTLSSPSVIKALNSGFIPIRVDSDRRPDINRRYNQGGWPTVAFLIPSGRHIAGMTFMPAPQMLRLLDRILTIYADHRKDIEADVSGVSLEEHQLLESFSTGIRKDLDVVQEVQTTILQSWDRQNGGLGSEPKFPNTGALNFVLERYVETGKEELKALVESTLDAMCSRDLFDRIEGGFFRYATTSDWRAPHFEKMLADNAELISLYLKAGKALERDDYQDVAGKTLEYVLSNLTDDNGGGFYGSQDADEEYYSGGEEERFRSDAPAVDKTIYVDSTSLMVSALINCSSAFDRPELIDKARGIADYIWENGFKGPQGICHYFSLPGYVPDVWGQPADQVNYLAALIDLYEATFDPALLERANTIARLLSGEYVSSYGWISEVQENVNGNKAGGSGVLSDVPVDLPEITGNGLAIKSLIKLDILNGGIDFSNAVNGIISSLTKKARAYGFLAAGFASALDFIQMGPLEIKVSGGLGKSELNEILAAAIEKWHPRMVVTSESGGLPVTGPGKTPPVLLCAGKTCYPVYDGITLGEAVLKALKEEQLRSGIRT